MIKVALALGGGGIRGIAHIGVMRVLEQNGFTIAAIAGTSAGGLAGAVYAAGFPPDEIESILKSIDQGRLFSRLPSDNPSLLGFGGMTKLLSELLGEKTFADLRIPFVATATDSCTGEEVLLHHGRVLQAILATSAVPGIFPARQVNDLTLIDGAVVDPVPVAVARWLRPDLPIIAVALTQPETKYSGTPGFPLPIPGPAQLVETFSRLRIAQSFNIFVRSVEISTQLLTELRLEDDRPDLVIRPELSKYGLFQQVDVSELVKLGEQATRLLLPELKRVTSFTGKLESRLRNFTIKNNRQWKHDSL